MNYFPRATKLLLILPKTKILAAKHGFVSKSVLIWNNVIDRILNECKPEPNGIMIPGSNLGSDLSISISIAKRKLKGVLLETQMLDPRQQLGWKKCDEWCPVNFFLEP